MTSQCVLTRVTVISINYHLSFYDNTLKRHISSFIIKIKGKNIR